MAIQVFVDCDGTITENDFGNGLFARFGGADAESLVRRYRAGEISAVECFRGEAAAMGSFDREEMEAWIDTREVDATFLGFREFCAANGIGVTILSDGLDLYVNRILARAGLKDLVVYTNHAELVQRGSVWTLEPEFPWRNTDCAQCACCKRNVLLGRSGDDDIIVYIGDGFTDRCPVRYADIVFARGELQRFCQQENISYHLFPSFAEVKHQLEMMTDRKKLRPRREAERLRRSLFIAEGEPVP